MRSFLWTILTLSLVLMGLAEFAPAWAIFGSHGSSGTVIHALCVFARDGKQGFYAAATVATVSIAVLAIFGKINWGWVGTLLGALLIIGVLANLIGGLFQSCVGNNPTMFVPDANKPQHSTTSGSNNSSGSSNSGSDNSGGENNHGQGGARDETIYHWEPPDDLGWRPGYIEPPLPSYEPPDDFEGFGGGGFGGGGAGGGAGGDW